MEVINHKDKYYLKTETGYREILASTNKSLRNYRGWTLPRPSKEFLEKYCELGEIKEVLVEYTDEEIEETFVEGSDRWSKKIISPSILKVASDNTITIKLIKDSWNRDDIKNILLQFAKDCGMDEDLYSHYNGDYKGLDNWIKENL